MFCNHENVNILTSLLVQAGIGHAVVCPGSRNAPIVHNLSQARLQCHPITDERSAAFYALGIAQATGNPVAVVVTSGTALLDTAPAVAEATAQHNGIIVVSADRPQAWIGQLDGQTLPQPGALGVHVAKCVSLPQVTGDESRWHCNRLVNEALLAARSPHRPSVHINVPIAEPLFQFATPSLPRQRLIERCAHSVRCDFSSHPAIALARRPMVVLGQMNEPVPPALVQQLRKHFVVLAEPLACDQPTHHDEVLFAAQGTALEQQLMPDLVIHAGGEVVSKRLKQLLRRSGAPSWHLSPDGDVHDMLGTLALTTQGNPAQLLQAAASARHGSPQPDAPFAQAWSHALQAASRHAQAHQPAEWCHMAALRPVLAALQPGAATLHCANSTAVRLGCALARQRMWVNRGVNGIDGSTSTAAGAAAVATTGIVLLVTGDLSFFYDQNALWNTRLSPRLRILLLNNGTGGIFRQLPGLEQSPVRDTMAAGSHNAGAAGICAQNGVHHIAVHNAAQLQAALPALLDPSGTRPMVLEAVTSPDADERQYRDYYRQFRAALTQNQQL